MSRFPFRTRSSPTPKSSMKAHRNPAIGCVSRWGVAYGTELSEVETALLEVARSNSSISQDPAPRARFRVFGDSALQFELLCWAKKPADRGRVIHELNSAVYRKFQQKNITIPFPQQDIYLHSLSSNASGLFDAKEESKK